MRRETGCLPLIFGLALIAWLALVGTVVTVEAVIDFIRAVIAGECS